MDNLVNPKILELMPYKPGKPVEDLLRQYQLERAVKLASNENPRPVPAAVTEAIQAEIHHLNLYPDSNSYQVIQKLAHYNGIGEENVIVGAGSVELIRMIILAFLKPGETVLTSAKTFMFYKVATVEVAGKSAYVEAPMGDDYTFDLDAMYQLINQKTKIIFLTNPNNPTGTMVPKQKVLEFINKVPEDKIIVMDHAYHEYVSDPTNYADGIQESLQRKNVIVLRTFSKIYALAGLRIGYAISNPQIIAILNRVKAPFNVSRMAQVAAIASLESENFKIQSATLNLKNRQKLYDQLTALGLWTIPSQANFLLFIPRQDTSALDVRLQKEGVIVRPVGAFGVPEGIRVTVGLEEENDFFIEKLKKVL